MAIKVNARATAGTLPWTRDPSIRGRIPMSAARSGGEGLAQGVSRAFAAAGQSAERVAIQAQDLFDKNWTLENRDRFQRDMLDRYNTMSTTASGATDEAGAPLPSFSTPAGPQQLREWAEARRAEILEGGEGEDGPSANARLDFENFSNGLITKSEADAWEAVRGNQAARAGEIMTRSIRAWSNQLQRDPDTLDTNLEALTTRLDMFAPDTDEAARNDLEGKARSTLVEAAMRGMIFAGRTDEATEILDSGKYDQDLAPGTTRQLRRAIDVENQDRRDAQADKADVIRRDTLARISAGLPHDDAAVDEYEDLTTERDADRFQEEIVRAERVRAVVDELNRLPPAEGQIALDRMRPDPKAKNFAAEVDILAAAQSLFNEESGRVLREREFNKPEVNRIVENTLAAIDKQKPIPEGAIEKVTELAGAQAGARFVDAIGRASTLRSDMAALTEMTQAEGAAWLAQNFPQNPDLPEYAKAVADYSKIAQGWADYRARLQKDPVATLQPEIERGIKKWRIEQGMDPDDSSSPREHAARTELTRTEQQKRGIDNYRVLSKAQATTWIEAFDQGKPAEQAEMLSGLRNSYLGEYFDKAVEDLSSNGLPGAAVVAANLMGTAERNTARRILEGRAVEDKARFLPKGDEGSAFSAQLDAQLLPLFRYSAPVEAAYRDAVEALYVYDTRAALDTSQEMTDAAAERLDAAISEATGGVIVYNGQPILPPNAGVDPDQFETLMRQMRQSDLVNTVQTDGSPMPVSAFGSGEARLISIGEGLYGIELNGRIVPDRRAPEDPFTLDFNKMMPQLLRRETEAPAERPGGLSGVGVGGVPLQAAKAAAQALADYRNPPPEIVGEMPNGRPILRAEGGELMTEQSVTVRDIRLNDGAYTNIPTIFGGVPVDQDTAIAIVVANGGVDPDTGDRLAGFETVKAATAAAKRRSDQLGEILGELDLDQPEE